MKIIIGNDHAGYALKKALLGYLGERPDLSVSDAGSHSEERALYPLYALKVAGAVSSGDADRGILICATGIGVSIVANRLKNVRATLCTNAYMGIMARAHNDSNILCLGSRVTDYPEALEILGAWLDTPYEGGRHDASINLLCRIDNGDATGIEDTDI